MVNGGKNVSKVRGKEAHLPRTKPMGGCDSEELNRGQLRAVGVGSEEDHWSRALVLGRSVR